MVGILNHSLALFLWREHCLKTCGIPHEWCWICSHVPKFFIPPLQHRNCRDTTRWSATFMQDNLQPHIASPIQSILPQNSLNMQEFPKILAGLFSRSKPLWLLAWVTILKQGVSKLYFKCIFFKRQNLTECFNYSSAWNSLHSWICRASHSIFRASHSIFGLQYKYCTWICGWFLLLFTLLQTILQVNFLVPLFLIISV